MWKVLPDGNLINMNLVKWIEIANGKFWLYFIDKETLDYELDGDWHSYLKYLGGAEDVES